MPPQPAPPSRSPLARRVVMSLLAAAALGGLVYVAVAPTGTRGPALPSAVESVSPQGGDLDLRQVTIAADLAPGYTGYLLFDGNEIPEDDLQHVDALNSVTLRPGPDSDYRTLSPGPHCATVVYRHFDEPRDASNEFRWCFTLH
ncbi:MAG: hypothetical protein ABR511_03180 [Acidimicrobiales bacterium]